MSFLIKNLDMPTEGELLCINIHPDGKVCINLDLDCKQVGTAVLVPPHGRLIDADAFAAKIIEIIEQQGYDEAFAGSLTIGEILRDVVHELNGDGINGFSYAPTIIEAEEGE